MLKKGNYPGWRHYGKRFLTSNEFTQFCTAVGLYHSHEWELEEFERQRLMFPAARIILPDEYVRNIGLLDHEILEKVEIDTKYEIIYELDRAVRFPDIYRLKSATSDIYFRHPIDNYLGRIEELVVPSLQDFSPWEQYEKDFEYQGRTYKQATANHFYHYWQIYEFFQVRKQFFNYYQDPAPVMIRDLHRFIQSLNPYLDAMSYFQFQYRAKTAALLSDIEPDEDYLWRLNEDQQEVLNKSATLYAQETLRKFSLSESNLYEGLNRLCQLHREFEILERIRLAETIKLDIWRTVELIYFSFGTPTEEISQRVGRVADPVGDYIELLFPNQRKQTRAKARKILINLAEEHNRNAPNFLMDEDDIDKLLEYVGKTELSLFGYLLEQSNEAFFARNSWQAAEAFLQLKSFASFPESLMKIILKNSADAAAIQEFNNNPNTGMGSLNRIFFESRLSVIWSDYYSIHHRASRDTNEFTVNLSHHISLVTKPGNENRYLGANLSLATCIRNFTSHFIGEYPELLRGQYVRCIRAITTSIFLIWHAANQYKWIH